MAQINCPSCHRALRLPDGLEAQWLTCPRCLHTIANPRYEQAASGAITAAPESPRPTSEEASSRRTCPACGSPVEAGWRMCPHCEEPLKRKRPVEPDVPLEKDVRRDSTGVGIGLIVLGALGGVGMFLFLCGGGLQGMSHTATREASSIAMIVALVLLIPVVIGGVLAMRGRDTGGRILAILLTTLTVAMLVIVVGIAGFIMTIASCLEPCDNKKRSEGPVPLSVPALPLLKQQRAGTAGWRCVAAAGWRMLPSGVDNDRDFLSGMDSCRMTRPCPGPCSASSAIASSGGFGPSGYSPLWGRCC
jgi:hypothetical protein